MTDECDDATDDRCEKIDFEEKVESVIDKAKTLIAGKCDRIL
jgi:hypothetical protein